MAQMGTAFYAVPQSGVVTILKELAKAKKTNQQLRKSTQPPSPKPTPPPAQEQGLNKYDSKDSDN